MRGATGRALLRWCDGIKAENPQIWTPGFHQEIQELVEQAVELEIAYAQDCLPRGILGLNADLFRQYVQYIADWRLERVGLPASSNSRNPIPWMSETIDLGKEKNFFETRVTEYQTGGALNW
jgi:ribonucleoside-diphosphate reductase beta chain